MQALALGATLLIGTLSASCYNNAAQITGEWVAIDKEAASLLVIWSQNGETYCRIEDSRYTLYYDFWHHEYVANSSEQMGCFSVRVTRRFNYLPQEHQLAVSTERDAIDLKPELAKYSRLR